MAEERWAALESNPDVLSKFCRKMGVGEQFEVGRVLFVNHRNGEYIAKTAIFGPKPQMAARSTHEQSFQ